MFSLCAIIRVKNDPDDGKQAKTFSLNFFNFIVFNLVALHIRYILSSEHYGQLFYSYSERSNLEKKQNIKSCLKSGFYRRV